MKYFDFHFLPKFDDFIIFEESILNNIFCWMIFRILKEVLAKLIYKLQSLEVSRHEKKF